MPKSKSQPKPKTAPQQETGGDCVSRLVVPLDRGWKHERTEHPESKLEKALAELWEERNAPDRAVNFGAGLLQDLFLQRQGPLTSPSFKHVDCVHKITADERMVAATVVQWLGSNCGRAFLHEAARRAEMYLDIRHNDKDHSPTGAVSVSNPELNSAAPVG